MGLAYAEPGVRAIGIDASAGAIAAGTELAHAAGVTNVSRHVADLRALGPLGEVRLRWSSPTSGSSSSRTGAGRTLRHFAVEAESAELWAGVPEPWCRL